jgi:hypothetical protein
MKLFLRQTTKLLSLLLLISAAFGESYALLKYPMGTQSFSTGGVKSSNPTLVGDVGINPALSIYANNILISTNGIRHLAGISGFSGKAILPIENHFLFGELLFLNYGNFDLTDQYGNINGRFSFYELAVNAGYAYKLTNSLGLGSVLTSYQRRANGDINNETFITVGAIYRSPEDSLTIGMSLDHYPLTELSEPSPFSMRLGFSNTLAHLPLRISIDGVIEESGDYHFEIGGNIEITKSFLIHVGMTSYRFDYQTGVARQDVFAGASLGFSYALKKTSIHWGLKSYASMGTVTQAGISRIFW